MKLAYFSPMPPARTGVATYSGQLAKALARHCDLTVFTQTPGPAPIERVRIVDFVANAGVLRTLPLFDRAIYHLGNNPWFHLDIRKAFDLCPGTACLHDTVLYFLAAGLGRGGLLRELLLADPDRAFADLERIARESPEGDLLRYPTPYRHPCIRGILAAAPHIVVHNKASAASVIEAGYGGALDVVPHLHYAEEFPPASPEEARELRRALGYEDGDFVLGAFGFIGPTKRLDKVLEALSRLRGERLARRLRLLVVGEGEPIAPAIERLGLQETVRTTGFIADAEFRRYLGAIDALVNLRYPSHGETSGSLIQAMSYGRHCLVSDHGSFSELPDDTVSKVRVDEHEVEDVTRAVRAMAENPEASRAKGEAARRYILATHSPEVVARRLLAVLAGAPGRPVTRAVPDAGEPFEPREYLRLRAEELARV